MKYEVVYITLAKEDLKNAIAYYKDISPDSADLQSVPTIKFFKTNLAKLLLNHFINQHSFMLKK